MSSPLLASLREWTGTQWLRSRETALSLLRGRGEGDNVWTEGERVLHLRRPLSAAERDLLPPGWMAIPAVDRG